MPRADLAAAVKALVPFFVPCKCCAAPATRTAQGRLRTVSAEHSAAVDLCDDCPPPKGGPLGRYAWGQAIDLPHASALRGVMAALST